MEIARELVAGLPKSPEIYHHGNNKQSCPCPGCCAGGYVLIRFKVEEYFGLKASMAKRYAWSGKVIFVQSGDLQIAVGGKPPVHRYEEAA